MQSLSASSYGAWAVRPNTHIRTGRAYSNLLSVRGPCTSGELCSGVVYCDVMSCHAVWCDVMCCDAMRCGVVWCDAVWYGVVWFFAIWFDGQRVKNYDAFWYVVLCRDLFCCNMFWDKMCVYVCMCSVRVCCDVMWCDVMRCNIIWYVVIWCVMCGILCLFCDEMQWISMRYDIMSCFLLCEEVI